jgi:hypothetical protein
VQGLAAAQKLENRAPLSLGLFFSGMKGHDERDDDGNHGKQRRDLLQPSVKVEVRWFFVMRAWPRCAPIASFGKKPGDEGRR